MTAGERTVRVLHKCDLGSPLRDRVASFSMCPCLGVEQGPIGDC